MSIVEHNMESEKRFIELLGYNLVGTNGSNLWLVMDENQNKVGYIQYEKLHNGNPKKGYAKIFGYHTFINSPSISCEFSRPLNDKNGKILNSTDINYSFNIKRDNHTVDYVEITDYPTLRVWSEEYGFIEFKIDYRGLYLSFKSKTENFNIEELLIYRNVDEIVLKEYAYQLRYCDKNHELSDDNPIGRTSREISGIEYDFDENPLKISRRTWVDGKLRFSKHNVVKGTVEEMAAKHQMGIDCFNHFRFFINQIIPFKEDVISLIVSDDDIKECHLSMFFPDYEKEITETAVQKKLTPNKNNN